jgi:phospholipase D1/2
MESPQDYEIEGSLTLRTTSILTYIGDIRHKANVFCRLYDGFLAIFDSEDHKKLIEVVSLCWIELKSAVNPKKFKIKSRNFSGIFKSESRLDRERWCRAIALVISQPGKFASYAPIREDINAQWLLNGEQYYKQLIVALKNARYRVCIASWCVSPGLYLDRSVPIDKDNKLINIIKKIAKKGVKVYVMIWNAIAFNLKSTQVCERLNKIKNVYAIAHRPNKLYKLTWSHHQKAVSIDDSLAYVGGIDLCYGRYDDTEYHITDEFGIKFPGHDYQNLNHAEEQASKSIDRTVLPRLPWHDIQCQVDGKAAYDIQRNFMERWNFLVRLYGSSYPKKCKLMIPLDRSKVADGINSILHQRVYSHSICQALRSFDYWGGANEVEKSIYHAYKSLIINAKYYIYISNQYFISAIDLTFVNNTIAKALYKRLKRAIKYKQIFRVFIVLPVFPAGDLNDPITKLIIKFENKTCKRIIHRLSKEFPETDINEYLNFSALRNLDWLNGKPVSEQIYVHSKFMIVDDRDVIIGSANINDRSMTGDRDSELCVHIQTQPSKLVFGKMNGVTVEVSPFARDLRIFVWKTLLGIHENEKKLLKDPISNKLFNGIWKKTAIDNTLIYTFLEKERIIAPTPFSIRRSDQHVENFEFKYTEQNVRTFEEYKEQLRGFLVSYAFDFLVAEHVPLTWKVIKDFCL